VTAVIAISLTRNLIERWAVFTLSSPLPRILITIGEESIGTLDVETTKINGSLPCFGFSFPALEDSLAHFWPVAIVKLVRSHNMLMTWHLVKTKLCAILVSPRTTSRVNIDSSLGENISVIIGRIHTWYSGTEIDNFMED